MIQIVDPSRYFDGDDYGLMRHTKDEGNFLAPWSVEKCMSVIEEFAKKVKGKKVVVFHPLNIRHTLTAKIVRDKLVSLGIEAVLGKPIFWLMDRRDVNNERLRSVAPKTEGVFYLFVTSEPHIEEFLGKNCGKPVNNTIVALDFVISGNR